MTMKNNLLNTIFTIISYVSKEKSSLFSWLRLCIIVYCNCTEVNLDILESNRILTSVYSMQTNIKL